MFGGIFGSIFEQGVSEFDRKPESFNGSFSYSLPDNATVEEKIRMQQFAQETLQMASMSQREQLEFLKNKTGLR